MYTSILFAIIGAVIFLYRAYKERGDLDSEILSLSVPVTCISGLLGFMVALALPMKLETTQYSVPLESLKDNASVKGSFFLGCGQIEGRMKYVYYAQNEDSTFSMYQVDFNKARIKYSSGTAQVHVFTKEAASVWYNRFALDLDEGQTWFVFEVPRGSIKNEYQLDAQ